MFLVYLFKNIEWLNQKMQYYIKLYTLHLHKHVHNPLSLRFYLIIANDQIDAYSSNELIFAYA